MWEFFIANLLDVCDKHISWRKHQCLFGGRQLYLSFVIEIIKIIDPGYTSYHEEYYDFWKN